MRTGSRSDIFHLLKTHSVGSREYSIIHTEHAMPPPRILREWIPSRYRSPARFQLRDSSLLDADGTRVHFDRH
jgi:hypothetical protein